MAKKMKSSNGVAGFKKNYNMAPSENSDGKADLKKIVNLTKRANHQSTKM